MTRKKRQSEKAENHIKNINYMLYYDSNIHWKGHCNAHHIFKTISARTTFEYVSRIQKPVMARNNVGETMHTITFRSIPMEQFIDLTIKFWCHCYNLSNRLFSSAQTECIFKSGYDWPNIFVFFTISNKMPSNGQLWTNLVEWRNIFVAFEV